MAHFGTLMDAMQSKEPLPGKLVLFCSVKNPHLAGGVSAARGLLDCSEPINDNELGMQEAQRSGACSSAVYTAACLPK